MTDRVAGELVEVVDPDGSVERLVTRGEMRAGNLRHRATYVVVRDREGRVLVHQRAPWKDIWPSRWDVAFGGVCAPGESWVDAAARELAEEAGLDDPLVDLGPVRFENALTRVVGRVFSTVATTAPTFPDGEVVDHRWVPVDRLGAWAAEHELCDDSAAVVLPLLCQPERQARS
ncbi:MAG TPA: NUDIX domain-containing protein [Acidimicrobiales bacterium]